MNSAQTAESLTHAISPDGSARMKSINRGLDNAIGVFADEDRGTRMAQPCLASGVRLSDAMAGRFAILGSGKHLSGLSNPLSDGMTTICVERENHPEIDRLLTSREAELLVVRPDFYCFARVPDGMSQDESVGIEAVISALLDQAAPVTA